MDWFVVGSEVVLEAVVEGDWRAIDSPKGSSNPYGKCYDFTKFALGTKM